MRRSIPLSLLPPSLALAACLAHPKCPMKSTALNSARFYRSATTACSRESLDENSRSHHRQPRTLQGLLKSYAALWDGSRGVAPGVCAFARDGSPRCYLRPGEDGLTRETGSQYLLP